MVECINESLVLGVDDDGELDQALKICVTVDLHMDDDDDEGVEECDNTAERSPVDINDIFVQMDVGHIADKCMQGTHEELTLYLFTPWPNPPTMPLSCIQEEERATSPP
jgi:hypothetical protein